MATQLHNLSTFDPELLPDAEVLQKQRYAVVVADWNKDITYALAQGAIDTLLHAGVTEVGPYETDACPCRGRPYVHVGVLPGVQSLSFEITGIGKGILSHFAFCLKMA